MYVINAIFKTQYFPTRWKVASIIPIAKPNKDNKQPQNYRPISLLNSLAKITEKIILSRIETHDNKHKITIDSQFGFRPRHNTTQQIVRITTHIMETYHLRKNTAMVLLDIEKAFDRVWHEGLIHKLIKYKFPPYLIKLIHSYLQNRQYRVKINNSHSNLKIINAGVPQGSVLGPKLFILFVNDIPQINQHTNLALYADDTAIFARSFNAGVANKQNQIHIDQIVNYFKKWKINLNPTKTENILFTKKYTNNRIIDQLKVDGQIIPVKNTTKYLGIHLDRRLTFKDQIKNSLRKSYGNLRNLFPLLCRKSCLSLKNKKLLYKTILRPALTYAAPAWCHTSITTQKPLQTFQNKCLRLILDRNTSTSNKQLHELAEIETINEHIIKISKSFYTNQLKHNRLTKTIKKIIESSFGRKNKYVNVYRKIGVIN